MDILIKKLLFDNKIEYAGIIPFSLCNVINPALIERDFGDKEPKSVIVLCVPYYTGEYPDRNVSLYAVPRDYHMYFRLLYSELEKELATLFPSKTFKGYADHSPIGETGAAARAGLGVIGDKHQMINEKYGSYTFIGDIITDMEFNEYDVCEVGFCNHCGACVAACPAQDDCLSNMTQRKGELSDLTAGLIKKTGIAWGCDICSTVCPMNRDIEKTPVEFFKERLKPNITSAEIENMAESDFLERAYSWRGKKTIIRNLNTL